MGILDDWLTQAINPEGLVSDEVWYQLRHEVKQEIVVLGNQKTLDLFDSAKYNSTQAKLFIYQQLFRTIETLQALQQKEQVKSLSDWDGLAKSLCEKCNMDKMTDDEIKGFLLQKMHDEIWVEVNDIVAKARYLHERQKVMKPDVKNTELEKGASQ
jgi:hypothetical protein